MSREGRESERGPYYQIISRELLKLRGFPFFLTPKDIELIRFWQEQSIPVRVVLEGLAQAAERFKAKRQSLKGMTLTMCKPFVEKAAAQHRERQAGGGQTSKKTREDKKKLAAVNVRSFLRQQADGVEDEVKKLLSRALDILEAPCLDESGLEMIDEEVDCFLWSKAERLEIAKVKKELQQVNAGLITEAASDLLARTLFVKQKRKSKKIPYVSLFYY